MVDFSEARKVLLGSGSPSSDTETQACKVVFFVLQHFFCRLLLCLPPQLFISLTRDVIIFVPGHSAASVIFLQCALAAAAHGDLSSPLCTLHNSFGQCSARSRVQLLVVLICDNSRDQWPVQYIFARKQNIP